MASYGWEEYDVRTGGKQVMYDTANKIDLTTEFVKVEGGEHGEESPACRNVEEAYSRM